MGQRDRGEGFVSDASHPSSYVNIIDESIMLTLTDLSVITIKPKRHHRARMRNAFSITHLRGLAEQGSARCHRHVQCLRYEGSDMLDCLKNRQAQAVPALRTKRTRNNACGL